MTRQFGGIHPGRGGDRSRPIIIAGFVLFLLFAGTAFFFLQSGASPGAAAKAPIVVEKEAPMKMTTVLVPIQEIATGTPLEPRMFRKESRPQVGVSERAVKDFEEIRAHYARSLIVAGQPLHKEYITSIKPTNILTAKIPEGYRAVTINTDSRTSVEGFVRPGAKVDVEWATQINNAPGVVTIVENAKVLSAERQTTSAQEKSGIPIPTTVTLLVNAADAKKIQLASTTGKLSLSLRGDDDSGRSHGGSGITIRDLMPGAQQKARENVEGAVTIGGVKWLLVEGKLVPAKEKKNAEQPQDNLAGQ